MRHYSAGLPSSRQVYASAHARQAQMTHLHVVTLAGSTGPVCFCVWFLSIL